MHFRVELRMPSAWVAIYSSHFGLLMQLQNKCEKVISRCISKLVGQAVDKGFF